MGFFSKLDTVTAAPLSEAQAKHLPLREELADSLVATLSEREFRRALCAERKRSERSKKNFVLMLIREKNPILRNGSSDLLPAAVRALGPSVRDTDVLGWFLAQSIVGVIFSELGATPVTSAVESIEFKILAILGSVFTANQIAALDISFHSYPENYKPGSSVGPLNPVLYPDLESAREK